MIFPDALVSGELALEPVISKQSGHIYESRLIKKVILESGKDPITGQAISEEDLIHVVGKRIYMSICMRLALS